MTDQTTHQQARSPLPCPFCGHVGLHFADGSTYRWGLASCGGCGATCGEVRRNYPPDDAWHAAAINEWNRRDPKAVASALAVSAPQLIERWTGDDKIESPFNACMHRGYCLSLKDDMRAYAAEAVRAALAASTISCLSAQPNAQPPRRPDDSCPDKACQMMGGCMRAAPSKYPEIPDGCRLIAHPITEEMHVAACKVLTRSYGLDGLPQRMLDAMLAAAPSPGAEGTIKDRLIVGGQQ